MKIICPQCNGNLKEKPPIEGAYCKVCKRWWKTSYKEQGAK